MVFKKRVKMTREEVYRCSNFLYKSTWLQQASCNHLVIVWFLNGIRSFPW